MLQRIRTAKREESGFTLIELLIVIVILGILAAVVVFAVNGITNKGKAAACNADLSSVNTAVEAFYAQTGGYPTGTGWGDLVPKFLHSQPAATVASSGYAITYAVVAGVGGATATPACSTL
jgi:general secretion pathway protein G